MSEPTFSDLHPSAESTLTTGVDLAGIVSADIAASSLQDFAASAHGDKLKKSVVLAYFTKAAAFADYGVRLNELRPSVPCEKTITTWEASHGTPHDQPTAIPDWGVYDYDFEKE